MLLPISHLRRRLLVGLLVLLTAGLGIAAPGARAATPPPGFFGVGNWGNPTAAQSTQLGQGGLRSYREGLVWEWVEHKQGVRNWTYVDQIMTGAAQNGYDVTLDINGCTAWACGATQAPPAPGAQQAAFEDFVAAAVARYGVGGSFWAAHPALQPRTVSWQVWNEVNTGSDWPNPTPAAYARLLALTDQTIKRVDPTATVVMSGLTELPGNSSGQTLTQFLTGLYQQPGFASSFDVAAVHGYSDGPAGVVRILDAARAIMAANGDGAKPLWITEMGWASGGPPHPFTTDPAGQAALLTTSFDDLLACRARWNLSRVLWFAMNDADPATMGGTDYWGLHTGLFNLDKSPKPAYQAFAQYLSGQPLPGGRGDTCTLPTTTAAAPAPATPAPDTTITRKPPAITSSVQASVSFASAAGPDTTITRKPPAITSSVQASVSFASAATGASGFQCSLDGASWAACAAPSRVRTTRQGKHTLSVRALTAAGGFDLTPARASWTVDRTPPTSRIASRRVSSGRIVLRFAGDDASGIAGYRCQIDARRWARCGNPLHARLARGRHVIRVLARDRAGNVQRRATGLVLRIAR